MDVYPNWFHAYDILMPAAKESRQAIARFEEKVAYALSHAQEGDCIVIAGKGHEDYQEIRGVKYPMDDRAMILEEAERLGIS